MVEFLLSALPILNRILVAGIAITAFSLLLYALTFSLRERVARVFALILGCIVVIAVTDGLASTARDLMEAEIWLRFQWIGTALLPAAYLHFSDALLASTGRPSRGRRRFAVRATYLIAAAMIYLATVTNVLLNDVTLDGGLAHLRAGQYFWVFSAYAVLLLAWTGINLYRAYRRCQTTTSRRRMIYLLIGSLAPAMAAFPYLLLLGHETTLHPLLVRIAIVQTNLLVAGLLVVLAYATAYFGVTYSDRVVKGKLFQWLLRGPLVAAAALAVLVATSSFFSRVGMPDSRLILVAVVMAIILLQFAVTVGRVPLERMLFLETRSDREEIRRLQWLEERLLTGSDLRQFLESLLAALCDLTRSPAAFIIEWNEGGAAFLAGVGSRSLLPPEKDLSSLPKPEVLEYIPGTGSLFRWGGFWLLPLHAPDREEMVGLIGLAALSEHLELAPEQREPLARLMERAAGALADERLQRDVFSALDQLMPDVEKIQRLSAAARYGQANLLAAPANGGSAGTDLAQWVREALSHYWGGPKLTTSPLLGLRVVREELDLHDGNAVNALRAVLRRAVERVRPEGERRFTSEWLLYNILEMKFLEGKRVRDVALRLAVSEADLYRKQKLAIEEVARVIAAMEKQSNEPATDYEVVG
ncbi:MAG: histidine kinase N-terminal 7TM domain-containing protein [Anaerolineales bacterium]